MLLRVVEAMMRGGDPGQNLRFAHLACDLPDGFPDHETCKSIEDLIDTRDRPTSAMRYGRWARPGSTCCWGASRGPPSRPKILRADELGDLRL